LSDISQASVDFKPGAADARSGQNLCGERTIICRPSTIEAAAIESIAATPQTALDWFQRNWRAVLAVLSHSAFPSAPARKKRR
jgi:hypothetical protein